MLLHRLLTSVCLEVWALDGHPDHVHPSLGSCLAELRVHSGGELNYRWLAELIPFEHFVQRVCPLGNPAQLVFPVSQP